MITVKTDTGPWHSPNPSSPTKAILDKSSLIVMSSGRLWLTENWACMSRSLKIKHPFLINIIHKLSIGKSSFDKFFYCLCGSTEGSIDLTWSNYLRSAKVVSKSWKFSCRVMAATAASRFSSGRSTTPGRKAILILTKASLQSASKYLAFRE